MPKVVFDSQDQQVGQDRPIDLPPTGEIDREIVVVEGLTANNFADLEGFMNEKVDVIVAESVDANAENPIQVSVNGTNQFLFRGVLQTVKRKYIEVLARAKSTDIRTQVTQPSAGEDPINRIHRRTALKYPFQIMRDDNRRGPEWLRNILAEA